MARDKSQVEKDTKKKMKKLGAFKPEYIDIIRIYSGMVSQYEEFEEQFEQSGYKLTEDYTNKAGATNERKVPLYTAMESLRKDIANYSDRLSLNPKALESVTPKTTNKSKLAAALSALK